MPPGAIEPDYPLFTSRRRPHSSLDRQTLDRAYFNRQPLLAAA
jgi:hypothetical protein